MLYTKGIEEELFLGTGDGLGVCLSTDVRRNVEGFHRELDERFIEYATQPCRSYSCLLGQMLEGRRRLRSFLSSKGDVSIIPGGVLPRDPEDYVCPTDAEDPYYRYLLGSFRTRAVAAGWHLNLGIDDIDLLMRAHRVTRLEAPIYIALTAASPFQNGELTGEQSTRWHRFPQEPFPVPLFESHADYVAWTEERLSSGQMVNVRHLWASVRPNGVRRPYDVNRLEVRACDSNPDPRIALAALALLESRAIHLASHPRVDIWQVPGSSRTAESLRASEVAACIEGLDAQVFRWDTGKICRIGDWIEDLYRQASRDSCDEEHEKALKPIEQLLENGNVASRWLKDFNDGMTVEEIVSRGMVRMEALEKRLDEERKQDMSLDNGRSVPCPHAAECHLVPA